ncbi:MAG: hypothetical protein JW729_06935 [Bacteroidales bacterium]|nr:hypothetical protein [Bacteroidales bacterium]
MKKIILIFSALLSISTFGQGFIKSVDSEDLGLILGKPCTITLASGEKETGTLSSAMFLNGYLDKITLKKENKEKLKLEPEDIKRIEIKASKLVKLAMIMESTSSIKEMTHTNFDEIVNREYIIFETAELHNKDGKLRLMQLLNPGFDSKIKVFVNPNANETAGLSLNGAKITGGMTRSYLFLVDGNQTVIVRKVNYEKNFAELYKGCPQMLQTFEGERIKWDDIAGHVFAYDQSCN